MSSQYDLAGARKAGISDEDSLSHLASVNGYDLEGARAAGISDSDSLNHLVSVKPPPEPVVEKESPEALGGMGAVLGGVGAAGDVIYSKGRPLFRMAEKAMGMDTGAPAVKPRTFLDPSAVAEQAIARRTAPAPDVTGSPESVKNWGVSQHKGEFLGGSEYGEADKIKKEALAFESKNPTQKVLPGSLLAVPQEEADRLAKQRAELAAQQDVAKQAEVQKVAQTRAERLNERSDLKSKSNQFGAAKGAGSLGVKVGAPILGGYEAGSQGAQAYNRLTRPDMTASDVAAGATNVAGAGAGALSMLPGKYRIPAAIISQGAGAIANLLDKRNPRNEEVEQKAAGGLAGYAEGGKPKLPGKFGKFQKVAEKAAHEFGDKSPGRMTDFLQNHIKKFVVPTQSDRMGGVGGPSFSANSIALPEYKGMVWGSGNEGTAKGITNLAKDERFGGPENQIFVPLLGHQNQHKSNQIVFDKLMKEFYENQDKLTPELIEKINSFMRSGGGIDKKTGQTNFPMFSGFDITNKDDVALLGKSFDNRGVIAQHAFGGERLDGKKAQIFPYQQRLDELADPTVAGAPTFAVGPRAFKLTGEINPEARPDLNAAFPNLLLGEDFGVTYKSTPNGVLFQDFQNQWRQNKGKTEPLKSGKLPEPGYYENTLGYKVNKDDKERLYPRQEITEQLLDSMYKEGYASGGKVGALEALAKKHGGSIQGYSKGGKILELAKDLILPAAENASRTQIIGTLPTYKKAAEMLAQEGAGGRAIDFGAGLGQGAKELGKNVDTYEPFAKNWNPTFTKPEDIPTDAYGRLTNLNVLNVVPRESRDEIVQHIGRVMEPGGLGVLTTRGADVMKAQGRPGPEPMSMITSRDTYQKGFTKQELEDYLRYMLGKGYDINKLNLGPAGVMIKKK